MSKVAWKQIQISSTPSSMNFIFPFIALVPHRSHLKCGILRSRFILGRLRRCCAIIVRRCRPICAAKVHFWTAHKCLVGRRLLLLALIGCSTNGFIIWGGGGENLWKWHIWTTTLIGHKISADFPLLSCGATEPFRAKQIGFCEGSVDGMDKKFVPKRLGKKNNNNFVVTF